MVAEHQKSLIVSRAFAVSKYLPQFPLTWNPLTLEYGVVNDPKKLVGWIIFNVIGFVFGGLMPFCKLLRMLFVGYGDVTWIQGCLIIITISGQTLALAFSYAIFTYCENVIPFGSQIDNLERSLQRQEFRPLLRTKRVSAVQEGRPTSDRSRFQKGFNETITTLGLSVFTKVFTFAPFVVLFLLMYTDADGLHLILPEWMSESVPGVLTRGLVILIFACEMCRTVGLAFVVGLLAITNMTQVLALLQAWKLEASSLRRRNARKRTEVKEDDDGVPLNPFRLQNDLQLYTSLRIFMALVLPGYAIMTAFALFDGFIIAVILNYIVFKMFNQLSLSQYVGFIIVETVPWIVGSLSIPAVIKLNKDSVSLLWSWRNDGRGILKDRKRVIKSLRPIAVQVGPFFEVHNSFKITFVGLLLESTINAMLLF